MNQQLLLLFASLFFWISAIGQKSSNVHIVTKKNNLQQYEKFNFEVNAVPYKLNDGKCIDMQVNTDSIHVEIFSKTVFRKKSVYDLRIPAAEEVYLFIYLTYEGFLKNGRLVAKVICEACYKELKEKCK